MCSARERFFKTRARCPKYPAEENEKAGNDLPNELIDTSGSKRVIQSLSQETRKSGGQAFLPIMQKESIDAFYGPCDIKDIYVSVVLLLVMVCGFKDYLLYSPRPSKRGSFT